MTKKRVFQDPQKEPKNSPFLTLFRDPKKRPFLTIFRVLPLFDVIDVS